jgi:hypothetical protein
MALQHRIGPTCGRSSGSRCGRASIDAIAEVFNNASRPNFTIGTVKKQRGFLQNVAAQTRTMQFGFRLPLRHFSL